MRRWPLWTVRRWSAYHPSPSRMQSPCIAASLRHCCPSRLCLLPCRSQLRAACRWLPWCPPQSRCHRPLPCPSRCLPNTNPGSLSASAARLPTTGLPKRRRRSARCSRGPARPRVSGQGSRPHTLPFSSPRSPLCDAAGKFARQHRKAKTETHKAMHAAVYRLLPTIKTRDRSRAGVWIFESPQPPPPPPPPPSVDLERRPPHKN
mmetsp:Transcript_6869/g.19368  ORF Transcript_6869/g.19368 Transcript_6869/m.19368 type:complete len:205 (+) Transcript_6869:848-1462(+)